MVELVEEAIFSMERKKSKFIAIAIPIKSIDEVKEKVKEIKNKYNATHVTHAAVLGKNGDIFSYSDDGEPKNTAGRPSFEVLKGSGITNILICVVRYFGGTLLGTGGLVSAYGDATKEVIKICKTREIIDSVSFSLTSDYSSITLIKNLLEEVKAFNINEVYGESVKIKGDIDSKNKSFFEERIQEIGNGRFILSFST